MRIILATIAVLTATCGSAFADCKSETTLPGFIIFITNKMKRAVSYSLSCANPP